MWCATTKESCEERKVHLDTGSNRCSEREEIWLIGVRVVTEICSMKKDGSLRYG